jgi:hypothetical protein
MYIEYNISRKSDMSLALESVGESGPNLAGIWNGYFNDDRVRIKADERGTGTINMEIDEFNAVDGIISMNLCNDIVQAKIIRNDGITQG